MKNMFKQHLRGQAGQALPIVLCVLAIGGLTVAGNLNFSTTTLNGGRITTEKSGGTYAAEAGIEDSLWSLVHGQTPPTQLGSSLNGMNVSIQTIDHGVYTLYLGNLDPSVHTSWVTVSANVTPSGGSTANYTISIIRLPGNPKQMKLLEVGAVFPVGYSYVSGSAAGFPGNLSNTDPNSTGTTPLGAQWVRWMWNQGQGPAITGNHTQKFRITGEGSTSLTYAWINVQSQDVSFVGEITGDRYEIEAVAMRSPDGKVTSRVRADVIIDNDATYILSWKVSN